MPEHWPVLASTKLLNALPTETVVVDKEGRIVFVNRAWREYCESHGGAPDLCLDGANYLKTCQDAAQRGDKIAAQVAAGLADVLAGKLPQYTCEYPCHAPTKECWFHLLVAPLLPDFPGAVLMHLDITERVQAEARCEAMLNSIAPVSRQELEPAPDREHSDDHLPSVQVSYRSLLQEALAAHAFGDAAPVARSCGLFARRLASLQTAPAELVRLHTQAVASVERSISGSRGTTLQSEARMILLRVLVDLATLYRRRALGRDAAGAQA